MGMMSGVDSVFTSTQLTPHGVLAIESETGWISGNSTEQAAARQLDAQVAVQVLGWKEVIIDGQRYFEWPGFTGWSTDDMHPGTGVGLPGKHRLPAVLFATSSFPLLPLYSTEIAAAWQVVDYVRKQGIPFGIHTEQDGFTVGDLTGSRYLIRDKDAPVAICKAALLAVQYHTTHGSRLATISAG